MQRATEPQAAPCPAVPSFYPAACVSPRRALCGDPLLGRGVGGYALMDHDYTRSYGCGHRPQAPCFAIRIPAAPRPRLRPRRGRLVPVVPILHCFTRATIIPRHPDGRGVDGLLSPTAGSTHARDQRTGPCGSGAGSPTAIASPTAKISTSD